MSRVSGDFWRLFSMVAVVIIHTAGPSEWVFIKSQDWASEDGLAVLLSQISRFCVPMLIVLSGYGLAASEANRGVQSWSLSETKTFWSRRGQRIVLPYLFWSVLTMAYMGRLTGENGSVNWAEIGTALLTGQADYHLYFIAFLLQGYVLWPLLRRPGWWLVITLLLVQIYFASPTHVFHPNRISIPGWAFIHWAGYFALGAKLSELPDIAHRSSTLARFVWVSCGALVLAEYQFWSERQPDPGWFNHFSRYVVIAYALSTVWLWRRGAEGLTAWLERAGWNDAIKRGSGLTFCVYFIHVWALRMIEPLKLGFLPKLAVVMLGVFGISWILDRSLVGDWAKWPRRCLGL